MAYVVSLILIVIAALHLLWALGYWFPIRDEARLARTVAGFKGIDKMPGAAACAMVVVALLFVTSALWWPAGGLRSLILVGAVLVFGLRGVAAYMPQWRRLTPEQPFATFDRRYFGPLCLFLCAGILVAY